MKLKSEVGTIEPGKRADIIILDANPLDNVGNIRKVKFVVTQERLFDSAKLWGDRLVQAMRVTTSYQKSRASATFTETKIVVSVPKTKTTSGNHGNWPRSRNVFGLR